MRILLTTYFNSHALRRRLTRRSRAVAYDKYADATEGSRPVSKAVTSDYSSPREKDPIVLKRDLIRKRDISSSDVSPVKEYEDMNNRNIRDPHFMEIETII